jgi:hypothetical protein
VRGKEGVYRMASPKVVQEVFFPRKAIGAANDKGRQGLASAVSRCGGCGEGCRSRCRR